MNLIKVILVSFAFLIAFNLCNIVSAENIITEEGYILSEDNIDTAYQIKKMISVQNTGLREECIIKNNRDIKKLIGKHKGNAAIFISYQSPKGDRNLLMSDAIIVKILDAKEIEKRSKKAEKPPVLKKKSKLDPEPVLIKYKDVKFPYKILGILQVRSNVSARTLSQQAMDYKLAEQASRSDAIAVLFVTYLRAGSDVSGASGIMVRGYDTWEEVEALKIQEAKIARHREEVKKAKEAAEAAEAEESKEETTNQ